MGQLQVSQSNTLLYRPEGLALYQGPSFKIDLQETIVLYLYCCGLLACSICYCLFCHCCENLFSCSSQKLSVSVDACHCCTCLLICTLFELSISVHACHCWTFRQFAYSLNSLPLWTVFSAYELINDLLLQSLLMPCIWVSGFLSPEDSETFKMTHWLHKLTQIFTHYGQFLPIKLQIMHLDRGWRTKVPTGNMGRTCKLHTYWCETNMLTRKPVCSPVNINI